MKTPSLKLKKDILILKKVLLPRQGQRSYLPARSQRNTAFSLVEVVLAIGVITFGMITVLGLMPVGLNTMRQAMDNSTEMQIAKQINGEALLTPFSQLGTSYSSKTFYYDDQGTRETALSSRTRYWANTTLTNSVYPGSTNIPAASPVTNSLITLRLDIVTAASANAVTKSTNTYNIRVPNSGS